MAINVEGFYDMINGIAKQQVESSRTDKTIDAEISKLYNADVGEYKVEYQGNIFSAFVPDPTVEYKGGERVYVLVPEGDFSRKKIILGRAAYQNSLSEAEVSDLRNTYIPMGPNFLDDDYYAIMQQPLEICAVGATDKHQLVFREGEGARYKDVGFERWRFDGEGMIDGGAVPIKEEYTRYPKFFMSQDRLDEIDNEFQNYAAVTNFIGITADFQTLFLSQHSNGEYGLSVTFIANNPGWREDGDIQKIDRAAEPRYKLIEYRLDFRSFNGSPYQLPQATKQTAYFEINPGELLGVYDVALYQNGQMAIDILPSYDEEGNLVFREEDKVLSTNNIVASNFELKFYRRVDMLDSPFYCWIETPQGTSLFNKKMGENGEQLAPGRTSLTLIPHMIFQNQDVTGDCDFFWFREDLSIPNVLEPTDADRDESGRVWTYYTGQGWRPIDHYIDRESHDGYVLEGDNLIINKEYHSLGTALETVPWQWRYKLVAIYGEEVFGFDTVTIKNADSKYDLFVEQFIGKDAKTNFLRVNDHNLLVGEDVDPDGAPAPEVPGGISLAPEWFGDWYYELADNSYNQLIPQMHHGPRSIQDLLVYTSIRFRVAAYDPHLVCPPYGQLNADETNMRSVDCVGILEYSIITPENMDLLIEWVGEKSFNYTAGNRAYDSAYNKDHKLSVQVNWVLGGEKQKGIGADFDVTVLGPDGIPLASQIYYNTDYAGNVSDQGYGHEVATSMMTAMYVDSTNTVHFKLKDQYDVNATDNTYTAIVHTISDNKWYSSECNIIFTKDGQNGTQGSEWTAPVRLTNTEKFERPSIVWQGVEIEGEKSDPYTLVVNNLRPLVLTPAGKSDGKEIYQQIFPKKADGTIYGIVIRPFVSKEGRSLTSLSDVIDDSNVSNDHSHYKIIAKWDVRFPQSASNEDARGRSFLELFDPITGRTLGTGLYAETTWTGIPEEFSQINPETGNTYGDDNVKYNAVGIRFKPDAWKDQAAAIAFERFKKQHEGLGNPPAKTLGFSKWTLEQQQKWTSDLVSEYWRLSDAAGKSDATLDLADVMYNFVVKCEIEIQTDLETKVKSYGKIDQSWGYQDTSSNAGVLHRLKTIYAYYPVDVCVLREYDPTENFENFFNHTFINWPTEFIYDSRGNSPQVDGQTLEFFLDFQKDNQEKSIDKFVVPTSLTPYLATITRVDKKVALPTAVQIQDYAENQTASTAGEESLSDYKWMPRSHLNWQEGTVAVIGGEIKYGDIKGTFYRDQIYYLNSFENVDINGWDGQGIDINEDNGTIFAPTIGAGFKGSFTNKFTGVLMGVNKGFLRDAGGINQYYVDPNNPTAAEIQELENNPFMTGLFGYQQGMSSFGILENGTAFFGRADRGGRIIIDGCNGTIYGGANGELGTPEIGDPMWNTMRLNLVDLTHSVGATGVQGVESGFDGAYFGKNSPTEYGADAGDMPAWFRFVWEHAYIKEQNETPWYISNPSGYNSYGLTKDGKLEDDLLRDTPFTGEYEPSGGYQLDLIPANLNDTKPKGRINYWGKTDKNSPEWAKDLDFEESTDGTTKQLSGFGESRASTTPAIEIGQHQHGLMPGLLPWGSASYVLSKTWIPGDRNFMITYDGTLWAMNGVFLGNVIGSNIVGGRIQGVEMGVGEMSDDYQYWTFSNTRADTWKWLQPPALVRHGTIRNRSSNGKFSVDPEGNVIAASLTLVGGQIDLGSFHIRGTQNTKFQSTDADQPTTEGDLLQMGHSDFVGPTHFYGNVGIGPALFPSYAKTDADGNETGEYYWGNGINAPGNADSVPRTGNLFQTNGIVALGIQLPVGLKLSDVSTEVVENIHGIFAPAGENSDGAMRIDVPYHASPIVLNGKKGPGGYEIGDPKILPTDGGKVGSVQQGAMFGIDSSLRQNILEVQDVAYMGHFWPIAYKFMNKPLKEEEPIALAAEGNMGSSGGASGSSGDKEPFNVAGVHTYMTTMDIFKSKPWQITNSGADYKIEGGNYFRVGPWGTEAMKLFFCQHWQPENVSEEPTVEREARTDDGKKDAGKKSEGGVRGFIGLSSRSANGEKGYAPAVGLQTWGRSPLIVKSDENMLFETQTWHIFYGGNTARDKNTPAAKDKNAERFRQTGAKDKDGTAIEGGEWLTQGAYGWGEGGEAQAHYKLCVITDEAIPGVKNKKVNNWGRMVFTIEKKGEPNAATGYAAMGAATPWRESNMAGLVMEPGDRKSDDIKSGYTGKKTENIIDDGYGVHLFTRRGNVHITRFNEKATLSSSCLAESKGGHTELLLTEKQARLYAQEGVYIFAQKDGSAHINDGTDGMKNTSKKLQTFILVGKEDGLNGGEYGIHLVAKTGEGESNHYLDKSATATAEIPYSEVWLGGQSARISASGAWSLCLDNNAHGPYSGPYRIGMNKTSTMWVHKDSINAFLAEGTSPTMWSTETEGMHIGHKNIVIGDSLGYMIGKEGKVYMKESWAEPDNQFCIYARFG